MPIDNAFPLVAPRVAAPLHPEFRPAVLAVRAFDDLVSLTDYRVTAGLERKSIDYLVGMRVEVGYVFNRELEYRSGTPSLDPSDTVLVRAGFFY